MSEARALLVKVRFEDGSEDWFDERDAIVYRVGEYFVVVDHDACTVVFNRDLLSALKEFNSRITGAEVVEE
jgi:hypothetical protein